MSQARWVLGLWVLLWSPLALAQAFDGHERLLLSEGVLRGSPRVLGIAGAFVAVAEGAEGITRNPAAAASKSPYFENELNVDFGAAFHFLPPWAVNEQDWDNDGHADQPQAQDGISLSFLGTQVLYLAGSVQYKAVGLGLGVDLQNFVNKAGFDGLDFEKYFNLNLAHAFGSLAVSLWEDQILLGLGAESTHAIFAYAEQPHGASLPTPKAWHTYHGWGVQFGGLWRPKDQDYRLGFSFRPQTVGKPATPREEFGGLKPFREVVAPARLSLGAAFALGTTGRHLNITSKEGWAPVEADAPVGTLPSPVLTQWLLTTQLDVFFPVQDATYVAAFLEQSSPTAQAFAAGNQISFEPRVAVEKELIENRLRMRAGGYLEPPLVSTAPAVRPHLTVGGEVYLFRMGITRVSFGLSFDLARNYQNLSVAFLAWR